MPVEFRWKLLGIMLAKFFAVVAYDYLVVNGRWQRKRFSEEPAQPAKKGSAIPQQPLTGSNV